MGKFLLTGSLTTCAILLAIALRGAEKQAGEKLEWRWSKGKASLEYSVKEHLPDYYLDPAQLVIRSIVNGKPDFTKVIYTVKQGGSHTVFTRWKDTLYIAEFSPIATGCTVVAVDLNAGKRLWATPLQGLGAIKHSQYLNFVNIETDGQRIIVAGNEAQGRYIEHLDIKTGKTLANKKFAADLNELFDSVPIAKPK